MITWSLPRFFITYIMQVIKLKYIKFIFGGPTLGPYLALTSPNSPGEIMFKFPYLALTRIISHKLAHSRNCKVDSNFNGHASDWSNWEKWST